MQRIPHHNARHAKPPAKPRQRAQIFALTPPPFQREHGLRRQSQLVRHSHADAAIADIEAEVAGNRDSVQLLAPSLQLNAPAAGDIPKTVQMRESILLIELVPIASAPEPVAAAT
jgi:hypothetical protein